MLILEKLQKINQIFVRLFQILIRFYQKTLSPDHGLLKVFYPNGYCKYYPSCSEYAYRALEKYGVLKGLWLGIKRVIRCNPFFEGGIDFVPPKKK